MSPFRGPFPVAQKYLVRICALACMLAYGVVSLDLIRLKPWSDALAPTGAAAPAEAAMASGAQAAPTAGSSAVIALPIAAGEPARKCCCRHAGNQCGMGCCAARDKVDPGEPCYRECGGAHDQASASLTSHFPAFSDRGMAWDLAACLPFSGAAAPFSFPSQPPEKVPIA